MSRPDPAQTEAVGEDAENRGEARRNSAIGPTDPLVGTTLFDRYKVIRRIGEGGMGIVYEAQHVLIEKRVALKVLKDDFSSRPDVVARFRQEAKSASRIGHENIVDISDFGETPNGQSYFVMEFLEGHDLASVLGREGTLEPARAIDIALQCCRALGAAHGKGIVHRDMKPENVFLVRRGDGNDFVKIVDFGIAKMTELDGAGDGRKLTKTGMIFGTPEYMSPEQASGKPLDHRVDVYAMGVILFEMLTGRVPFVGDTFMGILTQHLFEAPPALAQVNASVQCPQQLEAIIYACLAKTADERFASMDALAEALQDAERAVHSGGYQKSVGTLAGYGRTRTPISKAPETLDLDTPGRISSIAEAVGGRSRIVLVAAGALAFLGAVGFGAWFAANRTAQPRIEAPDDGTAPAAAGLGGETPPAGAGAGDTPTEPSGGPEAPTPPTGADVPLPRMITATVTTRPPGATIIAGGHQVCASTPCSFQTPEGERVVLAAKKGAWSARGEFTPIAASPSIELELHRTRTITPSTPPPRDPNSPSVTDLKTPSGLFPDP